MILLLSFGEVLLFLIFITMLRCNSLKEDNTAQLRQLNRNMTTFNDREELLEVIKDLNKKISKIV
tara:strand:- start:296 stop:490 length:195 start_codon:yes stop_codon:yes gene_type:complete